MSLVLRACRGRLIGVLKCPDRETCVLRRRRAISIEALEPFRRALVAGRLCAIASLTQPRWISLIPTAFGHPQTRTNFLRLQEGHERSGRKTQINLTHRQVVQFMLPLLSPEVEASLA